MTSQEQVNRCDDIAKDMLVSLGTDYTRMTNGETLAVLAIAAGRVLANCPTEQRADTFVRFISTLKDVITTLEKLN